MVTQFRVSPVSPALYHTLSPLFMLTLPLPLSSPSSSNLPLLPFTSHLPLNLPSFHPLPTYP